MSEDETAKSKPGLWGRFKKGLGKTRSQLAGGVGNLLLGEREIDDSVLEDLETALLTTDVGVDATAQVMQQLTQRVNRKELNNTRALHSALSELLKDMLQPLVQPLEVAVDKPPCVIFFLSLIHI